MGKLIRISDEKVFNKIYLLRGKKVMLDCDLALLYNVKLKVLNQAVKRNSNRFPEDFMFRVRKEEYESLKSQFVTLKRGQQSKYLPYGFTEQGVAMLSSVLNSETAIQFNIQIIRVFTRMRELILSHKESMFKHEQAEKKLLQHDHFHDKHEKEIQAIFNALKQLLQPGNPVRKKIGFKIKEKEPA